MDTATEVDITRYSHTERPEWAGRGLFGDTADNRKTGGTVWIHNNRDDLKLIISERRLGYDEWKAQQEGQTALAPTADLRIVQERNGNLELKFLDVGQLYRDFRSQESNFYPPIVVITRWPSIAVKYLVRHGRDEVLMSRFQLKFSSKAEFDKAVALFTRHGFPSKTAASSKVVGGQVETLKDSTNDSFRDSQDLYSQIDCSQTIPRLTVPSCNSVRSSQSSVPHFGPKSPLIQSKQSGRNSEIRRSSLITSNSSNRRESQSSRDIRLGMRSEAEEREWIAQMLQNQEFMLYVETLERIIGDMGTNT